MVRGKTNLMSMVCLLVTIVAKTGVHVGMGMSMGVTMRMGVDNITM